MAEKRTIKWLGDLIAQFGGERRVCVIAYHRILEQADPLLDSEPDAAEFLWQMEALAAGFNVLPLHDAVMAMREGRLPPRAVCITFDDGYRATYEIALPILKRLKLPATVFVTTGYLDHGSMWNDRIVQAVRALPEGGADLREFGLDVFRLDGDPSRQQLLHAIDAKCKYLHNEGRAEFIARLEEVAGGSDVQPNLMLTREMVALLAGEGIEIGGHTVTHPILTKLSDEAARQEIVQNKQVLEEITGRPLRLFAYPNGKFGMDFDERHEKMVAEAGYEAAFSTTPGAMSREYDLYRLPRQRPWDKTPWRFSFRLLRWLAIGAEAGRRSVSRETICGQGIGAPSVLLVAYHYPPQSESSGVQRTLSFSKYLPRDGWNPCVVSAHPMAYERKNSSQLAQIPSEITVKRAWALDAKRHLGLFGRYPELMALPDRWGSWWFSAVPLALSLVRRERAKVIWTTYPIATAHLIGLTLKRLTRLPWVADFRDPMLQDDYPDSRLRRIVYRWIERKTIRWCDAAVFTTNSACETYRRRYAAERPEKFHVIENGYDEERFVDLIAQPTAVSSKEIVLLHSGVLYSSGRDPSALFAAIAAMKESGAIAGGELRVVLRAPGDENNLIRLIQKYQVDDIVRIEPPISYQEALREMQEVDGLLVFQGTSFNTQVPAKIYEYFRSRKPILGLLDLSGETARVLQGAGFDCLADIDSADDIGHVLKRFVDQIRSGTAPVASPDLVTSSSRQFRARQLADLLGRLAASEYL